MERESDSEQHEHAFPVTVSITVLTEGRPTNAPTASVSTVAGNEDHDEDGDPARVAQGRFGEIRALRLFHAGQSRWYQGVRRFRCAPVDRPGEVLATDNHL